MSLNYEYLFSQIDKAKKKQKKGYIPWNSPESKKRREQQEKDQADKKRRSEEYIATHSSPGKKFVSEKLSRVAGRKRSGGKYNVGTEQRTRDTHTGRGKDNLRTIAERKEYDRMRNVDEKIRAGMTAIPYGHTNLHDYENTLWEQERADDKKRNQDNRIARERKVAGPGETASEYHKRTAAAKKKKEQAKQKKQTKQQATQAKEEIYDYEKDESEGKSGTYDPDKDMYGTDDDKGDYKNASVWKSWLEKKTKKPYVGEPENAKKWQKFFDEYKDKPKEAPKPKKTYTKVPSRAVGGMNFSDFEALEQFLHPDKSPKDKKIREGMVDTFNDFHRGTQTKRAGKALWKSWLKEKDSVDGKGSNKPKPDPTGGKLGEKGDEVTGYDPKRMGEFGNHRDRKSEEWEERQRGLWDKGDYQTWESKDREHWADRGVKSDAKPDYADWLYEKFPEKHGLKKPRKDTMNKSMYKAWLEKKEKAKPLTDKNCPYCENNYNADDKDFPFARSHGEIDRAVKHHHMMKILHEQNPDYFHKKVVEGMSIDDPVPKETDEKLKAEEGIGCMNMGSQRGLGHEAGYKQDPGQSAQITEVVEEEIGNESKKKSDDATEWHKKSPDKCVDCGKKGRKGNTVYPTYIGDDIYYDGRETGPGSAKDLVPLCQNCSLRRSHPEMFHDQGEYSKETKEENKSAYENHEQDEGAEVEPNKQQIPPSKPGMDVAKSLYKKALITKYNNIYKPANL
jgi:hypothetical protein